MPYKDLLTIIEERFPKLSKGQKRIGNYLLNHYEKAVSLTASRLGEVIGVSESTVVRFAVELGYEGYPELQKALKDVLKNKLTSQQRIEVSSDILFKDNSNILRSVLKGDIERINTTLTEIDYEAFELSVESILNAKRVYIVGGRSAGSLANYFYFYLNLMHENVVMVDSSNVSDVFEQIFRITKDDVLIGISFPRYSLSTIKAVQFAMERKATTIGITDNTNSPISKYSQYVLTAKTGMVSFVDSIVAPMSIISAMLIAISVKKKDQLYNDFDMLEGIWKKNQIYSSGPDIEGDL
ncbi:MurR/RpiR family transcriptional regulator [Anaeropeptidivorans aminofermentans]|jgi:DNA-binding MurR/RpiR family transcriptional regulator|uniref:MurR/RpiR family transcriptional regulator n=1 Tax=Anaeropeptidivorans aminofermentans TaxID=2934315 RepID=UPI002024A125|nr:MurR/RpiR family transcriptional regulator [Anaeropeptidivorans aminofermentans]